MGDGFVPRKLTTSGVLQKKSVSEVFRVGDRIRDWIQVRGSILVIRSRFPGEFSVSRSFHCNEGET